MAALFRRDLANVEAGLYPLPRDRDGSLLTLLDRSGLFFQDLPRVHRRREAGEHTEVLNEQTRGRRPNYYLQNFHFQTGGWMTEDSAKRYDLQVEVLFYGTANAIRRQVLPPLYEAFAGRDQRRLRLLDVGCGTGRFLNFVKQCWPRLPCIGLGRVLINCDHVRFAPIATPDVQPQQMTRWCINGLFGLRSGSSKANGKQIRKRCQGYL